MATGTSIFLIALGAIFKYAVTFEVAGVEIDTVGVILMIVGVIGLILSLIQLLAAGGRPPDRPTQIRRERYVERDRGAY